MTYIEKLRRALDEIAGIAEGSGNIRDHASVKNIKKIAEGALSLHATDGTPCWCHPNVEKK